MYSECFSYIIWLNPTSLRSGFIFFHFIGVAQRGYMTCLRPHRWWRWQSWDADPTRLSVVIIFPPRPVCFPRSLPVLGPPSRHHPFGLPLPPPGPAHLLFILPASVSTCLGSLLLFTYLEHTSALWPSVAPHCLHTEFIILSLAFEDCNHPAPAPVGSLGSESWILIPHLGTSMPFAHPGPFAHSALLSSPYIQIRSLLQEAFPGAQEGRGPSLL